MSNYGVKAADLSDAIYVGRLNAARNAFADKQDQTGQVLLAVAEWANRNFHGSAWVNVGQYRVDITVTALPTSTEQSPKDAA